MKVKLLESEPNIGEPQVSSSASRGDEDLLSQTPDRVAAAVHVLGRGSPGGHADPHGSASFPDCSSTPACAGFLNSLDYSFRYLVCPECDENLIQFELVQDLETGVGQVLRKLAPESAYAFHHLGHPVFSQEAQSPKFNGAGPS